MLIGAALLMGQLFCGPGGTCSKAAASQVPVHPANEQALAEPIVDADADLKAVRIDTWTEADARFFVLSRDVTIEIGTYGFRADRAVIRVDSEHRPGRLIRHLSMYLENARPLRGKGRVTAEARRMLVTASTTGTVRLITDLLERLPGPSDDELVEAAAQRTARYREALASLLPDPTSETGPRTIPATPEPAPALRTGDAAPDRPAAAPPRDEGFVPAEGVIIAEWENAVLKRGGEEDSMLLLHGGLSVAYQNYEKHQALTLTCQNAVIFLDPDADPIVTGTIDPEKIRGIYLEDNVIVTDGTFTVRAPRMYFDPATERAVVLDAVFYTWDIKHRVPIYVRARELRQASARSWSARDAVLTTSEFAEPHFSIAANQITVDLRDQPDGSTVPHVMARDLVPHVGRQPVGWFPGFAGDADEIPIRRIDVRFTDSNGPEVRTRWDLFSLLGIEAPDRADLVGQFDFLGEHGPGLGLDLDYEVPNGFGSLDTYLLPFDHGSDEIGGRKVDHDGDARGYIKGQHRRQMGGDWELSLELSYVNDPTFLEEFFQSEAETAKLWETSIYLKHQRDDRAFTFLAQYDLMDFTPQTTALQAPGYTVEKLPELGYYQVGTSLLDDRLTYFGETRASRMRIRVGEDSPKDRGFSTFESMVTFALPNTIDFDSAAAMAGIPGSYVGRFDTRHEVQAPMKLGSLGFVPYVAGRATFYDDDFRAFGGEIDQQRLWGMAGARLHTTFSRTYPDVESAVFDLHQLRHTIEPNIDIFLAGSTINPENIPVFDPDVEGIREGAGARFGLRHILQTQRGGPGRWRSVDWLVINTDLVACSDDADTSTDPARFFSFRPEYSTGGDHFYGDIAWMLSDSFAIRTDLTQDLENGELAQWHAGAVLTHSPDLTSTIQYTDLEPIDSRLLNLGFMYRITRKYRLGVNQRFDLVRDTSRKSEVILERKLPRWTVALIADIDDLDGDKTFGIVLIPDGTRSSKLLTGGR